MFSNSYYIQQVRNLRYEYGYGLSCEELLQLEETYDKFRKIIINDGLINNIRLINLFRYKLISFHDQVSWRLEYLMNSKNRITKLLQGIQDLLSMVNKQKKEYYANIHKQRYYTKKAVDELGFDKYLSLLIKSFL